MKFAASVLVSVVLLFSATTQAEDEGILVGSASVLQMQLGGEDNINDSIIGAIKTDIEDGLVLVGQANVVHVQVDGKDNQQNSIIGAYTEN